MLDKSKSLRGKNEWIILDKLSEGDAGVIYVVRSDVGGEIVNAILKKPQSNPLAAERQAHQITQEGLILDKLSSLIVSYRDKYIVRAVKPLDKSLVAKNKEDIFIVVERAPGFSLKQLFDVARNGVKRLGGEEIQKSDLIFLERIANNKKIPDLVVLRAFYALLEFLEKVHKHDFVDKNEKKITGIVWNDVKPDHVFWSPEKKQITIIDWGNSQFLESSGVSTDGNYSEENDFLQYIISMGGFLQQVSPKLHDQLDWPTGAQDANNTTNIISNIKTKLNRELSPLEDKLGTLVRRQASLSLDSSKSIAEMIDLHNAILDFGEWPDYEYAEKLSLQLINRLVAEGLLDECLNLCNIAADFPLQSTQKWNILLHLIHLSDRKFGDAFIRKAIGAVVAKEDNWEEVLWNLQMAVGSGDISDEWLELIKLLRQMIGISPDVRSPFSVLQEIKQNLDVEVSKVDNKNLLSPSIKRFFNLWKDWRKIPGGDISLGAPFIYREMKTLLGELSANDKKLSGLRDEFTVTVTLAETVAESFWDAWCEKDFDRSSKFLKRLLVYDPDCLRVFVFYDSVNQASKWLEKVQDNSLLRVLEKITTGLVQEGERYINLLGNNDSIISDKNSRADWLYEAFAELSNSNLFGGKEHAAGLILSGKSDLDYLDEYYSHIKKVRWNEALAVIEQENFKPYFKFYSKLIIIIQDVVKGGKVEVMPPPELKDDSNYSLLYKLLLDVQEWYTNLRARGIQDAESVYTNCLKKSEVEWSFLQNIKEKQTGLNEYVNPIQRIKEKAWNEALNALQSNNNKEITDIKSHLKNLLESLNGGEEIFDLQSRLKFDHQHFLEILNKIFDKSKVLSRELEKRKSDKNGSVWMAADWGVVSGNLKSIQDTSSELLKAYTSYSNATIEYDKKLKGKIFLDNLRALEFELSGQTIQSDAWIRVFKRIINEGRFDTENELDLSHPLYDLLINFQYKPDPSPFPFPLPYLVIIMLVGLVFVGTIFGGIAIRRKYALTPTKATEEIVVIPPTSPIPVNNTPIPVDPILPPTEVPTIPQPLPTEISVVPSTPIPGISSSVPPVSPSAATASSECDLVQIFVQNGEWESYKIFLNDRNANYEALQEKCGWSQSFLIRKIDVSLQSALKLSVLGEKGKARGEVIDLFENVLKVNPEILDLIPSGEHIDPFINNLRIYTSLCNSVPNGYLNESDKKRFLMFLEKDLEGFIWDGDLFNAICGKSPAFFQDTNIIQTHKKSVSLLKADYYPVTNLGGARSCIYFDAGSDFSNYHYFPIENFDCILPQIPLERGPISSTQVSFIRARICVVSPKSSEDDFYYGLFVRQRDAMSASRDLSESFYIMNRNREVYAELDTANVYDPNHLVGVKQFVCHANGGGVHITIRIFGNLLLWGFGTEDWESEQYYLGGVLNDEFTSLPIDIGFTGNASTKNDDDGEKKELHLIILNLDLGLQER